MNAAVSWTIHSSNQFFQTSVLLVEYCRQWAKTENFWNLDDFLETLESKTVIKLMKFMKEPYLSLFQGGYRLRNVLLGFYYCKPKIKNIFLYYATFSRVFYLAWAWEQCNWLKYEFSGSALIFCAILVWILAILLVQTCIFEGK